MAYSHGSTANVATETFVSSCGIGGYMVWYKFTASADMTVVASLCGSSYDTQVAILSAYDATCASLSCLKSNDDFCDYQSRTTSDVTAGETYYIVITGFADEKGEYILNSVGDTSAQEMTYHCSTAYNNLNTLNPPFEQYNNELLEACATAFGDCQVYGRN